MLKGNFGDSKSARFQRLSASIGRFSIAAATNRDPLGAGKRPSPKVKQSSLIATDIRSGIAL
jgi:hypothetical protein